jgi:hypothetical protein
VTLLEERGVEFVLKELGWSSRYEESEGSPREKCPEIVNKKDVEFGRSETYIRSKEIETGRRSSCFPNSKR